MSNSAAKEITDMLDASIIKVDGIVKEMKSSVEVLVDESREKLEQGAHTAKLCDEALESILTSVSQTDQMVDVIANGSEEQKKGVEEINRAMQQLDQTINQNASAARETAHASNEVKNESVHLKESIASLWKLLLGKKSQEVTGDEENSTEVGNVREFKKVG